MLNRINQVRLKYLFFVIPEFHSALIGKFTVLLNKNGKIQYTNKVSNNNDVWIFIDGNHVTFSSDV